MITIFSIKPSRSPRRPSPFVVSLLLHCAVLSVVTFGFHYSHGDLAKPIARRYSVQLIQLQPPEPASTKVPVPRDGSLPERRGAVVSTQPLFQVAGRPRPGNAKQTLVRPDVPPDFALQSDVPIPAALLWTQNPLPSPPEFITPPKEITDPARALSVPPSLTLPNREVKMANLNMSEAVSASTPTLALPPSATAPVRINGPEEGKQLPQTTALDSQRATPANLVSIPAVPLRAMSVIVIPPVNQIASENAATDHQGGGASSSALTAASVRPLSAEGASQGAGRGVDANETVLSAPGTAPRPDGSSKTNEETAGLTRITSPTDGRFGAVVLGSSASELYPESAGLLSGRLVYTVYVGVRLHKNWILQYCLPKGSEADGPPLEAPWPFLLLRPDQLTVSEAEHVIVHGLINSQGRFEQLALVFPETFPEKGLLFGALQQWSFRPARRDGQAVTVEALLIVPRQGD